MNICEIKHNLDLINSVDWEMTPEEAIALHLEWGPLRSQAYYNSRDNDNETVYFVINTWKKPPILTLVRRRGFDSEELGNFRLPQNLENEFMKGIGQYKGVYAVEGNVRDWLKRELDV
ncbi:DVU0772 family protein [Desulfobacula sp.]